MADWFGNKFKGEVELVLGPIYLINGCNSKQLLSSMTDLLAWCSNAGGPAALLVDTMEAALNAAISSGVGNITDSSPSHYRLPADLNGKGDLKPWFSNGGRPLPEGTKPLAPQKELQINQSLGRELQEKRSLVVGELPADRGLSVAAAALEAKRQKFLIIGASNSERLGRALEEKGIQTATTN